MYSFPRATRVPFKLWGPQIEYVCCLAIRPPPHQQTTTTTKHSTHLSHPVHPTVAGFGRPRPPTKKTWKKRCSAVCYASTNEATDKTVSPLCHSFFSASTRSVTHVMWRHAQHIRRRHIYHAGRDKRAHVMLCAMCHALCVTPCVPRAVCVARNVPRAPRVTRHLRRAMSRALCATQPV